MTTELAREMEAEMAETRRALLEDLNEIELINTQLRPLEARKRILNDRVKQGMGLAGLDELADGETGVVGKIQERAGTPLYDLVGAVQHDGATAIEALGDAALAGMVRIDHAMLKRFREGNGSSWADLLHEYIMPGKGTEALIVEQTK